MGDKKLKVSLTNMFLTGDFFNIDFEDLVF